MRVFLPTVARQGKRLSIARRKGNLEGQVWGFVDTSKVNADLFIENLRAEITKSYQPKDFILVRKGAPGLALSAHQLELLAKCAFVIFCFGD